MSKPGKSLKSLCKKLGVRLTVKRNGKRVYKSVKVLKAQCAKKSKAGKKKRRRRKFGMERYQGRDLYPDDEIYNVITPHGTPSRTPHSDQLRERDTPGGTRDNPGTPPIEPVGEVNFVRSYPNENEARQNIMSHHFQQNPNLGTSISDTPSQDSLFLSSVSPIENVSPQINFSEHDDVLSRGVVRNKGVVRKLFRDDVDEKKEYDSDMDETKEEDDGFGPSVDKSDKGIFTGRKTDIAKLLNNNNINDSTLASELSKTAKKATKKLSKEEILSIVAITIGIGGLTTGILGLQNKLK